MVLTDDPNDERPIGHNDRNEDGVWVVRPIKEPEGYGVKFTCPGCLVTVISHSPREKKLVKEVNRLKDKNAIETENSVLKTQLKSARAQVKGLSERHGDLRGLIDWGKRMGVDLHELRKQNIEMQGRVAGT